MSVDSYIDAYSKEPSVTVRFNGNRSRDILSVDISQSMDNLSSANIRLLSSPGIAPETKVQIKQGYNGQEVTTFTGIIDTIERSNVDNGYTVQARDMLKKALDTFLVQEVKFGVDVSTQTYFYSTYDSADGGTFVVHEYGSLSELHTNHPETTGNITNEGAKAEAVVQWLLHMSGLAEGTEIQVDDANFFIGDITPARFSLVSVYDAAMQIANLIGWRVFCDPSGICRFKKRPRNPSSFYPNWRYSDQAEPYNIYKLTRNESNVDLRTYVEVRGASGIKYVVRGTSPFLGNTPYRGVLISDELIDTPGMAKFMGDRILGDLNRKKVTISLESDGNPKLVPGSTVDVNSKVSQGKYLVESINTTESAEGGYKTSLNASAFYGDTQFEEPPLEIVANYAALQVIGIGDPSYMVEFDGSSSFSSVAPITRYVWTFPTSTQDGPNATAWYTFKDTDIMNGNSVTITLQVYDGLGNTASVSSGITLTWLQSQAAIKYRQLYAAFNTQGVGSDDGGDTWNTLTIPAVSVGASNFAISGGYSPTGYAVFGGSDGILYKTIDVCKTQYTVFNAGSLVHDVNIPELDSSFGAAVTEGGKVYRSVDSCETWTQIGSFAFPVLQAKYNYTNYNEITILGSGTDNVYITEDAGGSWTKIPTGVAGQWLADSNTKNYLAHTAGIYSISDHVQVPFAEGVDARSFPALTYAINVDDSINTYQGIMAVDAAGTQFNYSGGLMATQANPTNHTRHMIRDGDVPFLVYYANASGVGKSLDANITMSGLYYPSGAAPGGGWGYKVAYGPLASPILPARLIWRGRQLNTSNVGITDGFAYGGLETSGWAYIPGSSFGSDAINSQYVAVSAGLVVLTPGDASRIHYINVPADTAPVAHVNYATWEASQATGGTPNSLGVYISRKIIPSGQKPTIYGLVAGLQGRVPDLQIFPDFFNNPGSITSVTAGSTDAVSQVYTHTAVPKNKDKILFSTLDSIFATATHWYLYDVETETTSTNLVDQTGLLQPAYSPALTTDWLAIAKRDTGVTWEYTDIQAGTTLETLIPIKVPRTSIYESSIDGTVIYYAYHDNTGDDPHVDQGIFKVDSYGTGTKTTLLAVPDAQQIISFSVTHDVAETKDFLVVVIENRSGDRNGIVKYSIDAGATWITAPPLVYGTLGQTQGCWYVDVR